VETIARKNHDRMRMKDWIFFSFKKDKRKRRVKENPSIFFSYLYNVFSVEPASYGVSIQVAQ